MCLVRYFDAGMMHDFSILDANDGFFEFLNYTRKEFEDMGNRCFLGDPSGGCGCLARESWGPDWRTGIRSTMTTG